VLFSGDNPADNHSKKSSLENSEIFSGFSYSVVKADQLAIK